MIAPLASTFRMPKSERIETELISDLELATVLSRAGSDRISGMAERKKEKSKGRTVAEKAFRKRLEHSHLLRAIDEVYKKEYGCSAKRYLLDSAPRPQAERILSTLETAPHSITKMFRRRLEGKHRKDEWTPMIPLPGLQKGSRGKPFVEELANSKGFKVDFARLAGEGRLLYTTMKPSRFIAYAFGGDLIEERYDDDVPSTELNVESKEKRLAKGRPIKTPYLKLDLASCRFILHDGRHRVVAAYESGVKEIPVFIEHQVPSGRGETSCLHNRNRWKREDASSPNLRPGERV